MSQKLRCLIVEDEPLAASGLAEFIAQVPFLEHQKTCPDALEALDFLKKTPLAPDVLFLDIHLPGLRGLDFLRTLRNPPQVILTTAFHEHALDGFDLGAVDYLLKPFSFARFFQAVGKLRLPENPAVLPHFLAEKTPRPLFFQEGKRRIRVALGDLIFIEAVGEYARLHLEGGKKIVTKMALADLEKTEGWAEKLIRSHRSFLVNLEKIEAWSASEIELSGGRKLPVGRTFREAVEARLTGL